MAGRQSSAADAFSRNFAGGYEIGKDASQRSALRDLANHSYQDHVIPPQAASSQQSSNRWNDAEGTVIPTFEPTVLGTAPEDAGEAIPYAAGGDPKAVDKLLEADKSQGVLEEDPEYGVNLIDRTAGAYGRVPKVRVIDWEAAKKAKADMYARAGMRDKVANIDQEFDDLKRRKFQEYASRALQVWDTDPNRAAEYMTMANQFTADGTNSVYMPTPDGQTIMEVDFDEMTQKPLGGGSPIDKTVLERTMLMHSDPAKFGYWQRDREWAEQQHKDQMEMYNKRVDEAANQHRENLAARYKGMELDMVLADLRATTSLQEAAIRAGDTTGEELGKFKNKVLDYLSSAEKGFFVLGEKSLNTNLETGMSALAAGAGDRYITNGAGTGAAEAIRAQDMIMGAPITELQKYVEDGLLLDPKTGVRLKIPPSAQAIYNARVSQASRR